MAKLTIGDVTLEFSESAFSAAQWEQVASWVLNGGGEAAAESARIALNKAVEAVNAAANANRDASRAESYAVGGTGTREGEDTDNAKYYCEQTRRISGGEFIVSINGEGADETGNFTLNAEKVGAIDAAKKGTAGGVAELDATGKVPTGQLPATMPPSEHTHTKSQITDFPSTMSPNAHAETHKQGGSDSLTAADIGAVSNTGDTMKGDLFFKKTENGQGRITKNHSATEDYGTAIIDTDAGGNIARFSVIAKQNKLLFRGTNSTDYEIFGGNNKPTGTYKGNGDATSRTIDIGGIGDILHVYNWDIWTGGLVWRYGAIIMSASTISHIPYSQCHFENGVLTLATNNTALNNNGTTLNYRVL